MTGSEMQTPADSVTVGRSGEQSNSDAPPDMIDPATIQRAYAANVDALKVMDGVLATMAGESGSEAHAPAHGADSMMAVFRLLNRQLPKG